MTTAVPTPISVARQARKRAVFLDRDGVINAAVVRERRPYPPADVASMQVLPGVADALLRIKALGFATIVVTNQPDIARGLSTNAAVGAINAQLLSTLAIDEIRICPHDNADNCHCRKPKPGLLLDAAAQHGLDLALSFMVGDRWRDVDCGKAAGVRNFFLDYGYDEPTATGYDWRVDSLAQVADILSTLE